METSSPDTSIDSSQNTSHEPPSKKPGRKLLIIVGVLAIVIVIVVGAIGASIVLGSSNGSNNPNNSDKTSDPVPTNDPVPTEDTRIITAPAQSLTLNASNLSAAWRSNGPSFLGQGYDASVTDLSSVELYVGDNVSHPLGDVKILLVETTSVDTAKELLASYLDNENNGTDYNFVKMADAVGNESYQATLSNPVWPSYSDHVCAFRLNNVVVIMAFYHDPSYIMTETWMHDIVAMQLDQVQAYLP